MSRSARVAVLGGGVGSEAAVSRASAERVVTSLRGRGYAATGVAYGPDLLERLREGYDVVFNAMHGTWGEDGRVQALLEWLGLPYTGSDVTACALAFDKHSTKRVYRAVDIPTPRWTLAPSDDPAAALAFARACPAGVVVKPRREGSSSGVRVLDDADGVPDALDAARAAGLREVIVEERIVGRECTVGVFGEAALPVVEIVAGAGHAFYSYDAKYLPGGSRHVVPARLEPETTARLRELGLRAHRELGLREYSRTDILLDARGEPQVLETNALPGLTATSLLPDAAGAIGLTYDDVIEGILRMALERRA